MNISLTKELQEHVKDQMNTGYYASASEVVREALRHQLKSIAERETDNRISIGLEQIKNGEFVVANDDYFNNACEYIRTKHISKTI